MTEIIKRDQLKKETIRDKDHIQDLEAIETEKIGF